MIKIIQTELVLSDKAPTPLTGDKWGKRIPGKGCIGVRYFGKSREMCRHYGIYSIKLPDGSNDVICGIHLRSYARHGWIDANIARELLITVAEQKRQDAIKRIRDLKKEKTI